MEKVIQEFKIIETDDGFRIEIKGDKEKMREFVNNLDPRNWGGPWAPFRRHRRHRGPWVFVGRFPFGPPWMWWCGEEEEAEEKRKVKVEVESDEAETA